jgi:methyl-accepting chemotaxis protein
MGEATNLVHDRVLNVTNVLDNIAVGNTSRLAELLKIGKRSEQDRLMPAIIAAMDNVNLLIEDTEMLSRAALEGKLDIRADASKHQGEYRKVVEGVNDTLDAVICPLNVAAEYMERISRGDIPDPITDNYNGDFNEIKNNLNTCIDAVNYLVEDVLMLSKAGIAGQLGKRADISRHEGDFRKIVVGVNDTLDAVIGPLNEAIRVSNEFSDGNFRARLDENLHVEGDFVNFRNVLNNIGISVSEIIKSAQSVTMQVAEHSDEASRGASEVATAAGNVAMSSQKSSELTRELLYKIEGINKEIVHLSISNEKIADSSKGILSSANEVVRIGKGAQALGRETNLKMESVEKIAKESVDGINILTEQIKQIDGIVQLINDITSQINLLSLNAAIEAARAGEHGRGFAVVAGEVKNLATKARNATDTIETVVNSVQRDSKKTADAINTANSEIIDGVNSVNKTLDALNTIIKNATQVTTDIGDIAKAIDDQADISMKVVKASEEGNAMTQEVQREAEGLAATAQETSASVQEIGAAIHEVTRLSGRLKSEMEAYIV